MEEEAIFILQDVKNQSHLTTMLSTYTVNRNLLHGYQCYYCRPDNKDKMLHPYCCHYVLK